MSIFLLEKMIHEPLANLKVVLQDCFMKNFSSQATKNCQGDFGLLDFMKVSICIPKKDYVLKYIELQVKDIIEIQGCIFETIQFVYSKDEDATACVTGVLKNCSRNESMTMTIDVSEKQSELIAEIGPNGEENLLTLRSLIDVCGCNEPDIPDVKLPPIIDLHLEPQGLVCFKLLPLKFWF